MSVRNALLGFLFWTAVALFYSTQGYLGQGGGWDALETSLRRSVPQWYLWGLLSPFIFRADRWAKKRSRDLRGRVLRHVPLAAGFVSLYVVLRTLADSLLGNFEASWNVTGLAPQYHWNLLIYSVLVGIGIAYDLHQEARERELRAYELEARLAEARLETLKAQLRPHFLFNTLNAISAFVEKDPKVARRMTAHLGDLLRHSLESAHRNEVPLAEELATVDDYLAIQQIRFAGRLRVEREVAAETLGASVPGFLLQPLVENAVEHGLRLREWSEPGREESAAPKARGRGSPAVLPARGARGASRAKSEASTEMKAEGGRILLRAERREGSLLLTIEDDGVGFPPSGNGSSEGSGLKNVTERLRALYGERARLEFANGAGVGATVTVRIPWHAHE